VAAVKWVFATIAALLVAGVGAFATRASSAPRSVHKLLKNPRHDPPVDTVSGRV
jgi:hypothetical protein